ncbi:MAG: Gx transporter family protein [Clostridiales bacterium]|nr:Gx transporter family protein [Clostridiales bacterium]
MQIPNPVPIPGVKLGLANIITIFAVFMIGNVDAGMILLLRILLGGIFCGQAMSLMYSFAGGLLCYLSMLLMKKIVTEKQMWVCSVIGAIAHNIGQILVAILVTQTPALVAYLPVLMVSGSIAGLFTGFCAQYCAGHFKQIFPKFKDNERKKK